MGSRGRSLLTGQARQEAKRGAAEATQSRATNITNDDNDRDNELV
jgi:hypothetical protein